MMTILDLGGVWTVHPAGTDRPEIPSSGVTAAVPGCIHTDLLAAGLIPEPFDADNESALAWIGRTAWRYERVFNWTAHMTTGRVDLVAEALDTFATIELNGVVIGVAEHAHRSYRFDVGSALHRGENRIAVTFDGPVAVAEATEKRTGGPLPNVNHHPFNAVRKPASDFGWDWGIDAPSTGIVAPIRLEHWTEARITEARPLATLSDADVTTGKAAPDVTNRAVASCGAPYRARTSPGAPHG